MRYLTTAFNENPVKRDTRKCRDLILSEWYQSLWPEVSLVRTGEMSFANSGTGTREGVPFGSLTSQRGDRLIIDDPHSTETAESPTDRVNTTRKFREGATNRLNDQSKSAIVVIMQRLHEDDVSGVIHKLGLDYVHLCLPMEFEPERACETPIGFKDPRTAPGELLDPVRFPRDVIEGMKKELGGHAYAGQYQQRPSAREGGMFKRHWFQIVDAVPAEAKHRVRRWDLAATIPTAGSDPDWTAGVKMSTDGTRFYVEDVAKLRDTPAKVRRAISNTATLDGKSCDIVIPEDPGQAGKAQAQSIIAENAGYKIKAERETGDKATRAEPFAAQAEAGNVCLLRGAWNEAFIDELCAFPQGHDDQFDAAAGAFNHLAGKPKPVIVPDDTLMRSAIPMRRR
jgi:predicted phage terminase large subunit-like protein